MQFKPNLATNLTKGLFLMKLLELGTVIENTGHVVTSLRVRVSSGWVGELLVLLTHVSHCCLLFALPLKSQAFLCS